MFLYTYIISTGITPSFYIIDSKSRDSSVGIANSLGAGRKGFDSRQGHDIFLFFITPRQVLEPTQPPIQWMLGAASPGVERQGREADHSPPSSAEVKNVKNDGAIPPFSLRLHGVVPNYVIKYRDNFIFFIFLAVYYINSVENFAMAGSTSRSYSASNFFVNMSLVCYTRYTTFNSRRNLLSMYQLCGLKWQYRSKPLPGRFAVQISAWTRVFLSIPKHIPEKHLDQAMIISSEILSNLLVSCISHPANRLYVICILTTPYNTHEMNSNGSQID
jgi:hypothetical protein